MEDRKQKRGLRLGVLGMVLCMTADWLLDVMPQAMSAMRWWNPDGWKCLCGGLRHPFPHKHLSYIHGSHYMMPIHLKSEKLFVAERKYHQDSERYKQDMLREMTEFLRRW